MSVILPFHNAFATLSKSIESICQQSFSAWELLLIDNNSNDESLSTARNWQQKDGRIKIITEKKRGIAYALNTGLNHARARYIARMDADDWSMPQRLERQYNFMELNKDIGVVATQTEFRSDLGKNTGYRLFVEWQNSIISASEHYINRFVESPVAHPTVMFRKNYSYQFGSYDTGSLPEDYELWLRWMSRGVKFAKIPEKLVIWNDHKGRLSRNHSNYDETAFERVACHYLAQWVKHDLAAEKKIVVCGTGKKSRRCAQLLEAEGIRIYAFTDVVHKNIQGKEFIPVTAIEAGTPYFFINFIAKRGVRQSIKQLFLTRGLQEGIDFIM